MKDIVVATVPDQVNSDDILLPIALARLGIVMQLENDRITFLGVRTDQRETIRTYMRSIGLEFDPAASFWLL